MTDIKHLLEDDDPLRAEPTLARGDVDAMRRRVVATRATAGSRAWTWTATLATALILVITTAVAITWPAPSSTPGVAVQTPGVDARRRQLQFATPGGTRVIWMFNDAFDNNEVQ